MYNSNHIRNILKEYIDKKIDKYIIYPFGVNGVSVKNVLKDYFNLEPCLIVDNGASQYNPVIINFAELKRVYQEDMYVILTIEDDETNTEMMSELSTFIRLEQIVNLNGCEKKEKKDIYDGKGFMLADFLPLSKIAVYDRKSEDKIKIRIVHRSATTWNTISTICQAFREDPLFDVLLIVHTDWTREQSIRQIEGRYEYVTWDEYRVESDRPDILVIGLPWFEVIDGLINSREYVKLIVAAYWSLVRYDISMEEFRCRLKNTLGIFRPDYYLFDSLQYKEIRESDFFRTK